MCLEVQRWFGEILVRLSSILKNDVTLANVECQVTSLLSKLQEIVRILLRSWLLLVISCQLIYLPFLVIRQRQEEPRYMDTCAVRVTMLVWVLVLQYPNISCVMLQKFQLRHSNRLPTFQVCTGRTTKLYYYNFHEIYYYYKIMFIYNQKSSW